jgi:hypothetical protein
VILNYNLQRRSQKPYGTQQSPCIRGQVSTSAHHLPLLHRTDSTYHHLLSPEWHGGILLICWLLTCHSSMKGSARILAPPPLWLQKHTIYMHSPHLWHEPWLAKCSSACSRRLCEITWTVLIPLQTTFFPVIYEYSIRKCSKYWQTCFRVLNQKMQQVLTNLFPASLSNTWSL